jgi:hypothetical protein
VHEVGNQDEATAALRILRGQRNPRGSFPLPPGWSRAGQGTTRIVLQAPSGAVYKVPCPLHPNWEDGILHNRREAEHFARWQREGHDFVAEWHLYEVRDGDSGDVPVMAMEFLENDGSKPANLDAMWAALAEVDAEDRYRGNYGVRAGKAIVIDAGGAASPYTPSYLPPETFGRRPVPALGWEPTDLCLEPEWREAEQLAAEHEPARWVNIVSGGILLLVLVGAAVSLGRWFNRIE